jgi:hypothetical protein
VCTQVFAGETILERVYLENATQSPELSASSEAYIDLQLNILRYLVETKQQGDGSGTNVNTESNEAVINNVRRKLVKTFEFEVEFAKVCGHHHSSPAFPLL